METTHFASTPRSERRWKVHRGLRQVYYADWKRLSGQGAMGD